VCASAAGWVQLGAGSLQTQKRKGHWVYKCTASSEKNTHTLTQKQTQHISKHDITQHKTFMQHRYIWSHNIGHYNNLHLQDDILLPWAVDPNSRTLKLRISETWNGINPLAGQKTKQRQKLARLTKWPNRKRYSSFNDFAWEKSCSVSEDAGKFWCSSRCLMPAHRYSCSCCLVNDPKALYE